MPSGIEDMLGQQQTNRSRTLQRAGVPTYCHTLVADPEVGTGIKCSSVEIVLLAMSKDGRVMHTDRFPEEHPRIEENVQLKDTNARLARIVELAKTA